MLRTKPLNKDICGHLQSHGVSDVQDWHYDMNLEKRKTIEKLGNAPRFAPSAGGEALEVAARSLHLIQPVVRA